MLVKRCANANQERFIGNLREIRRSAEGFPYEGGIKSLP